MPPNSSKFISSSLEVQIQKYTNIEKYVKISLSIKTWYHTPPAIPIFEAAAKETVFLVHGHTRSRTEVVPQRRDVAEPGRGVDAATASVASWWRLRSWANNSSTKMRQKSEKWSKITETLLLGQNFGLFLQFVKEAFDFSDGSLFVPVVFCFDVIFGVPNVPLGCGEDVYIRLGVKDCTRNQKTNPKQGLPWDLNHIQPQIVLPQLHHLPNSKTSGAAHATKHKTPLIFSISTPRNSKKFSNWLEHVWTQLASPESIASSPESIASCSSLAACSAECCPCYLVC